MTIGNDGNVYILLSPRVIGSWAQEPFSNTGSFIIYNKPTNFDAWLLLK